MTDSVSMQRIINLEREFNQLKAQNIEIRNRVEEVNALIIQSQAELSNQQAQNEAMLKQVHDNQEQEIKNDELDFELQKIEGERDFHRKHHIEAKKTEHNRKAIDVSLNSLKRELQFKREESDSLKRWLEELNAEIDDLSAFIKRPSTEQKSDAEAEAVYSQKVVELESSFRKIKERNTLLASGVDREKQMADSFQFNGAKVDQTRIIISENEALRQKVESIRKENLLIKSESEKLRQAQKTGGSAQNGPVAIKFGPQEQGILDKYSAEIETQKKEGARLKSEGGPVVREFSDQIGPDLAAKIAVATQEKQSLDEKAQQLMAQIQYKDREIENLKLEGSDGEAARKMVEANKKMALEVNRLQDQIRKMESFSRDSLINSINN